MTSATGARPRLAAGDVLLLIGVMAVYYCARVSLVSGDSLLAWPITDSLMHPERYSPGDLIVSAGTAGNFLLYRLLAAVPFLRDNLPLRDFLMYIPIFFCYLVAWWFVFTELGGSRLVSIVAVTSLLFSDFKLGLNWSISPLPNLISATSVQFLQVAALYLFLSGRRGYALALTALTGYFHPATALSFGAVYTVVIMRSFLVGRQVRHLYPVLWFVMIYAPNAFMIARNSQGAFQVSDVYHTIFRMFQFHAFLEDHFRMGYAYTLALLALMFWFSRRHLQELRHREELFLLIGAGIAGSTLWLINLYYIKNTQVTLVYFIMRIFYLIKPLAIFLAVLTANSLYRQSRSISLVLLLSLFLLTPLLFSPTVALIIVIGVVWRLAGFRFWVLPVGGLLATFCGIVMKAYGLPLQRIMPFLKGDLGGNEFNVFQLTLLVIGIGVMCFRPARLAEGDSPVAEGHTAGMVLMIVPVVTALLVSAVPQNVVATISAGFDGKPATAFSATSYWGVRQHDPAYAELLDWARIQQSPLFAVPPYDNRFMSFRYLTGKGVYAHQSDINQLAYSPAYYYTGYARLLQLGLVPDPEHQKYRWAWGYETLCRELIRTLPVNVLVFEKRNLSRADCGDVRPIFENGDFIAFAGTQMQPR